MLGAIAGTADLAEVTDGHISPNKQVSAKRQRQLNMQTTVMSCSRSFILYPALIQNIRSGRHRPTARRFAVTKTQYRYWKYALRKDKMDTDTRQQRGSDGCLVKRATLVVSSCRWKWASSKLAGGGRTRPMPTRSALAMVVASVQF